MIERLKAAQGDETDTAARLRLVVGRLARQLRQHSEGLTPSQSSALASINRLGSLRLNELAEIESIAAPTLSRIVGGLQEKGLVERSVDPHDGRATQIAIPHTLVSKAN